MIQGSNQARTARSAIGQEICGRTPFSSRIFFPRSCYISRNLRLRRTFQISPFLWFGASLSGAVGGVIPTKRESATDQLPVPPDGVIISHLILGPAQSVFDLLVALLDPLAQPIEPDHFFQAGWRERQWRDRMLGGSWQICHQIPGGLIRQRLWIGGGDDGPFGLVWSIWSSRDFQHPPLLGTARTPGSDDLSPLPRLLCTLPTRLVSHLLQGACHLLGMVPGMRRLECHHIGHTELLQPTLQAAILSVEVIRDNGAERPPFLNRLLDQLQRNFEFGAKGGIVSAFGKVALWGVRFGFQRVIHLFVGPQD